MFQLFKIRGFAEYISDTFSFLKLQGKSYFKNYLKFSFVALLLLMVSLSLIGTFYYRFFTSTIGFTGAATYDNSFITENAVLLVIAFVLIIIISLYLSLLNYSYPVYYLHLVGKNGGTKPELRSIRKLFKNDLGRLLVFGLLSFIVFAVIGLVAFAIAAVLTFVIIGIFVFMLIVPFFITWYSLTLFYYIDKKQSFFDAFKYAFYTITNNFWNIVGSTFCMLMIVYVLSMIVTMIPYFIIFFAMIFGMQGMENGEAFNSSGLSIFMIIMIVVYCFSILVSMILNHLVLIQTGLVYYSEREKLEYNTTHQSIDEIGRYE